MTESAPITMAPEPITPHTSGGYALLNAVLADANQSPSWSNTQPYRIAIATGAVRDQLAAQLTQRFDAGMKAQRQGWLGKLKLLATQRDTLPDGDFKTSFDYPEDLQPARRATGHGLYERLGIGRKDTVARDAIQASPKINAPLSIANY